MSQWTWCPFPYLVRFCLDVQKSTAWLPACGMDTHTHTLPHSSEKHAVSSLHIPIHPQGQRPRGAHGPWAAFQDGQPPAPTSTTMDPLPGARGIQLKPHSFLCSCPRRAWVVMVSHYSHTRPSQGAYALHPAWAPWQAPRQICNSLHLLVWVSHAGHAAGVLEESC